MSQCTRAPAGQRIWFAIVACLGLVAGACSSQQESTGGAEQPSTAATDQTTDQPSADSIDENVPLLADGKAVAADLAGPSAELITLSEDPFVAAAVYPRPSYEANPWSQWGQGIVLDDGRVITGIGDHLGIDGNSYLYVYDPDDLSLTRFADVLSALDHQPGSWGYGKIHSQMVDPGGSSIFFATYYGTRRDIRFDGSYQGDVLFGLDKQTLELKPVVVPTPGWGIPSLASDGRGLIYGEGVDPTFPDDIYPTGGFFVFDTVDGEMVRVAEDPEHVEFRNMMVAADGTAWYARSGGSLFRYDPGLDEVAATEIDLGSELRASTVPASDGTIYGVTDDPFQFFAFDPTTEEIRSLGEPLRYTTSLALLPDESGFLYVPGAHGDAFKWGTPLIAVDRESGEQTTLVELNELVKDEFGLVLGGTYSVTVDPERGVAHIGFNAGATEDEPWGEVVFVVVDLP